MVSSICFRSSPLTNAMKGTPTPYALVVLSHLRVHETNEKKHEDETSILENVSKVINRSMINVLLVG